MTNKLKIVITIDANTEIDELLGELHAVCSEDKDGHGRGVYDIAVVKEPKEIKEEVQVGDYVFRPQRDAHEMASWKIKGEIEDKHGRIYIGEINYSDSFGMHYNFVDDENKQVNLGDDFLNELDFQLLTEVLKERDK